ncbi:MAG: peptide chain release factor N(5)-glutamine methyltransferase [Clostridia bacterium]|nr:peptide chain release factor N(5)-glutamine methyltransferase [Clostridia bacterium]
MTIKETIRKGMIDLKNNGISEPKLKARLLMQFILNKPRQYLLIYDYQTLTLRQQVNYFKAIKKVANGEPIQHITHRQEFMKMDFYVNEEVLIPRPDTETLVEEVIKIANKIKAKKILDLCTGSGAIAVSLAKYIEGSEITAVDISRKALRVAKLNAKNNEVESQITFIESDLFEQMAKEKYDIIVSNPPYIRKEVIQTLDKEVQREPKIALDGGEDGLDFYRKIIHQSEEYLKFKGYLCLEIGYDQKIDVIELIEKEEKYVDTYCKQDLYGNDRVILTKLS